MERQKTAVERLLDAVALHGILIDNLDSHYYLTLEKEQIKEAYKDGFGISLFEIDKSDEQYFTTKYGKQ